jgi:hypothetical protein
MLPERAMLFLLFRSDILTDEEKGFKGGEAEVFKDETLTAK